MYHERILVVKEAIDAAQLEVLAKTWYGTMVKGVADVKRGIIALGGDWHMDANNVLLADGSKQEDMWGFNIYPNERGDNAIEYISLINIRPAQGNKKMELTDENLCMIIRTIVKSLIPSIVL